MKHLAKICIFITPFVAEAAFAQDLAPATPESQGVSSRAILRWIEECETTAATNGFRGGFLHGFVIVRHGKTIAEGTWAPQNTLERPHMLYSHSKSFTSTAIGFLVDEGKIDLDSRVLSFFPDVAPENPSENLRQVRVRDLLTMNLGAVHTDAERDDIAGDWVKAVEAVPGGWSLNANGRRLRVGDGRWLVTQWKFNDTNVEPLFGNCGTHEIAATGRLMPDGSLSVTWQFLGGIRHGRFSVGILQGDKSAY